MVDRRKLKKTKKIELISCDYYSFYLVRGQEQVSDSSLAYLALVWEMVQFA